MSKIEKLTDACMTGGMPESNKRLKISQFSTYIFSADISPEMLKLGRVTKVKVLFLVLVFVFHFQLLKMLFLVLVFVFNFD